MRLPWLRGHTKLTNMPELNAPLYFLSAYVKNRQALVENELSRQGSDMSG